MGCKNVIEKFDLDLITSSGGIGDLKITKVPPPEIQNEGCQFLPSELNNALRIKLRKLCGLNVKFYEISTEEFKTALNRNYFANDIINLYASKINIIPYEEDVYYKDLNPIKVIDNENCCQYYKGGFNKKGQCHGQGIWIKDFNVYIGNFKNDEFDGTGLFITEQGDYYFGQWKNSQYNGYGSIVVSKKLVYRGFFKNGKKEGFGEEQYPDGDYYDGAFYNGEKNGRGTYLFSDGTNYDGYFKNSKYNGYGKLKWGKGDKIKGDFKDGKLDGQGNFWWGDGVKFAGNFIDDKKTGRGTYVWQDGKTYTGYWKDNNACGTGIYNDPIIGGNENIIIN